MPSFQIVNNKGDYQTAWMHRLVCACCLHATKSSFSLVEAHIINE